MATECAGVTVAWGGVSLGEVVSLKATIGNALPLGRSSNWSNEPGSVEIACLATAGLSATSYGLMKTLSLAGGGLAIDGQTSFTAKAILQRFDVTGSVNDVTRYSAQLRLVSLAGTAVTAT